MTLHIAVVYEVELVGGRRVGYFLLQVLSVVNLADCCQRHILGGKVCVRLGIEVLLLNMMGPLGLAFGYDPISDSVKENAVFILQSLQWLWGQAPQTRPEKPLGL